ncbi:MAG: DUF4870 domain-containing protein [Luteibaculaceae bacterium]
MNNTQYHNLPQPQEITMREKEDAMGSYLMMFASVAIGLPLPVINLIAAVIYYYINRKRSRFVHFHSLQSLLSQLPTTVVNWVLFVWIIRIWIVDNVEFSTTFYAYAIFAAVANLTYFTFSLIAAFNAYKGKMYYFIFFGPFCYNAVFRIKAHEDNLSEINKPPF